MDNDGHADLIGFVANVDNILGTVNVENLDNIGYMGNFDNLVNVCYVDNVVQANLLAATTVNLEATNQVYNIAVGDRTTLNELYRHIRENLAGRVPYLENAQPVYREFRSGDVRHSQADVSKAVRLLSYQATHRVAEGLAEALEWYVGHR
jgi:UDP-N-acetylglucosamine 4-epimerase